VTKIGGKIAGTMKVILLRERRNGKMTLKYSYRKWIIWVLVIAVSFSVGFLMRRPAGAATAEPGSSADPIAAKSYVDEVAKVSTFKTVTLSRGAKLVASAGVELIIREGSAVAVDSVSGGLSDVTKARDIKGGEIIPLNHLIVVPRTDGRGFLVDSNRVIVIIKGNYTVIGG
jgi:hypothetical protein